MKAPRAPFAWVTLACALGCSSVELYPITRDASPGGAGSGASGSGGGGSSAGGTTSPASCNVPVAPSGDSRQTVLVDGLSRTYLLHLPSSYDPATAAPLVLDFHGIGETGTSERQTSPYPDVLDREGVVMAFPDGRRGPAGTGWNVGPCCVADVDDVAFARAVVAHVQTLACVDPTRVYAVGVLTGGGMAHYVGCRAADIFAGVAPAAFDLLEENVADCLPSRPVTVVSFRSTADPRVPYAGGESALVPGMPLTFLGAKATFAKWAEIDACPGQPSPEDANGCSAYSGCAAGAEVLLCTRDGQDQHSEPSVVWPVLRAHTL
jgi:polyhydroxybutyrate depolymerase